MTDATPQEPPRKRPGKIGLALSGGGFRAALFHLGVIRHLSERHLLEHTTHVCSVSGGSILAAHMVLNWQKYLEFKDDAQETPGLPKELLAFAAMDVRNRVFRRAYSAFRPLRPIAWSPTRLLQQYYSDHLYGNQPLSELRSRTDRPKPQLHILTTELETGQLCSFSSEGFHYRIDREYQKVPAVKISDQPIGLAVAASSAVPTVFHPVKMTPRTTALPERTIGRERMVLTDGGVYDNLGITPFVSHLREWGCETVFVSDASRVSDWIKVAGWSLRSYVRGLKKSYNIAADRLYERDRETFTGGTFVHLPITHVGSQSDLISDADRNHLQSVPTDLDALPVPVVRALVVHGQLVAEEVLKKEGFA